MYGCVRVFVRPVVRCSVTGGTRLVWVIQLVPEHSCRVGCMQCVLEQYYFLSTRMLLFNCTEALLFTVIVSGVVLCYM